MVVLEGVVVALDRQRLVIPKKATADLAREQFNNRRSVDILQSMVIIYLGKRLAAHIASACWALYMFASICWPCIESLLIVTNAGECFQTNSVRLTVCLISCLTNWKNPYI